MGHKKKLIPFGLKKQKNFYRCSVARGRGNVKLQSDNDVCRASRASRNTPSYREAWYTEGSCERLAPPGTSITAEGDVRNVSDNVQ